MAVYWRILSLREGTPPFALAANKKNYRKHITDESIKMMRTFSSLNDLLGLAVAESFEHKLHPSQHQPERKIFRNHVYSYLDSEQKKKKDYSHAYSDCEAGI